MSKNILSMKVGHNHIEIRYSGTLKKKFEVLHNGIVVETKEARRFPKYFTFEVIEANEYTYYEVDFARGNDDGPGFYRVMRNREEILKIG
ncbi:MAG: hypothetical protein ACW98Y_10245 [Candidatus Thorarchaeota archaeon]|jgi:hypothetical protein